MNVRVKYVTEISLLTAWPRDCTRGERMGVNCVANSWSSSVLAKRAEVPDD
jgi:hypothetical protein